MDDADLALKSIAKGAGFAFAGLLISKLLGYIYRLLAARLGPGDYGNLSIALALFNFFGIIAVLGLTQGVQRYVPYYLGKKEEAKADGIVLFSLRTAFVFGLVIGFLLFLFSDLLAVKFFHEPKLSLLIKLIAFIVPIDVVRNIFINLCKAHNYIIPEVFARNLVENFSKIVLTAIFLLLGYGLFGAALGYVLAIVISTLFSFYFVRKVFSFSSHVKPVYERKVWLAYSIPLLLNHFLLLVMLWTDTLMLGFFRGSNEVGVYNAAAPTAQLIYVLPAALLSLFLPVLSGLYSKSEKKAFNSCYLAVTKWIFIANVFVLLALGLFSRQILGVLFGKDYIAGGVVLVVLVAGYFIYHLSLASNNILMIVERTKLVFFVSFVGAVFNVILNYLLIPDYGFLGAGIATSSSVFVMGVLNFIITTRIIKFSPFNKNYLRILLPVLITFFALFYARKFITFNIFYLIIVLGFGFLLYVLLLFLFKVFDKEDIVILKYVEKGFVNKFVKVVKKFV